MTPEGLPDNWPIRAQPVRESSTETLAHDLKNLLTVLAGCVDCLEAQVPHAPGTAAYFVDIRCGIDCLAQIASELAGISHRSSSHTPTLEINRAIENMSAMLRRFLGSPIELTLELAATPDRVVIHPLDLERILLNLILNARTAMADGGRLTISTVALEPHPDGPMQPVVRVTVSDTGPGIAPALFEEAIAHGLAAGDGSFGHGLSGVTETVRRLDGLIRFETEHGVGTQVHVDLPAAPHS